MMGDTGAKAPGYVQPARAYSLRRCFSSVDSSDCHPKFVAMDKEAKDQVVHRRRYGEEQQRARCVIRPDKFPLDNPAN
jgi:hypothetical protein